MYACLCKINLLIKLNHVMGKARIFNRPCSPQHIMLTVKCLDCDQLDSNYKSGYHWAFTDSIHLINHWRPDRCYCPPIFCFINKRFHHTWELHTQAHVLHVTCIRLMASRAANKNAGRQNSCTWYSTMSGSCISVQCILNYLLSSRFQKILLKSLQCV